MIFFDYIFYRIHGFYKKKDYIPVMMGIYFNLVLQICILFFVGILFNILTKGLFSEDNLDKSVFWFVYIFAVALMFLINAIRYSRKNFLDNLFSKFKSSSMNKSVKTWQVFTLPVMILFLSILLIIIVL